MVVRLISSLFAPSPPAALPEEEARLAMATLLVRMARADGVYRPEEITVIEAELSTHYVLDAAAARALRMQAEEEEAAAPDTVRFTRAVKAVVPHEERGWVLEALWAVALADGVRHAEEDGKMRLLAHLLGMADRDSAHARQRVQARGA
ncbi:MAG: TerB family tellurite resistance protein [Rhodobacteraceae bacterium]|nr:TerB family tellurite resistance protein [Paracoccaceae bacterium]